MNRQIHFVHDAQCCCMLLYHVSSWDVSLSLVCPFLTLYPKCIQCDVPGSDRHVRRLCVSSMAWHYTSRTQQVLTPASFVKRCVKCCLVLWQLSHLSCTEVAFLVFEFSECMQCSCITFVDLMEEKIWEENTVPNKLYNQFQTSF